MTDHITEAKRCLDGVHDWQAEEGMTDEVMTAVALEAQTHATLALVEQQRIANLIKYAWSWPMAHPEIREDIEKALGIS